MSSIWMPLLAVPAIFLFNTNAFCFVKTDYYKTNCSVRWEGFWVRGNLLELLLWFHQTQIPGNGVLTIVCAFSGQLKSADNRVLQEQLQQKVLSLPTSIFNLNSSRWQKFDPKSCTNYRMWKSMIYKKKFFVLSNNSQQKWIYPLSRRLIAHSRRLLIWNLNFSPRFFY